MAYLVDLLHLGQVWEVCTPAKLQAAAENCLQQWADASLTDWIIKKFHWTLYLGPALARFKKSPACFAMERKHHFVCRFANSIHNTQVYEKSVLQELLAEELFHLGKPNIFATGVYLVSARPPGKALLKLLEEAFGFVLGGQDVLSAQCQLNKSICTKHDVVLAQPFQAMQIVAFVAYANEILAFATLFNLQKDEEDVGACQWIETESHCLVPAAAVLCPLLCNRSGKTVTTLIPWQIRHFLNRHA